MNTTIKCVEAHLHRVNATERSIQTFKNHFIAGLCTVNKLFSLQFWFEIIKQAEMTLNILRATRINPKLSAYAILEGTYNFNNTPMAPPGIRSLVYTDPKMRRSWETHAKDGWYVGPASDHYRCFCFWIPSTQEFCNTQTVKFCPSYCRMPHEIKQNETIEAAKNIIDAIKKNNSLSVTLAPSHVRALKTLADIF